MSNVLNRIQAGEIDGRARNPRYIQKQLSNLHETLVANAAAIKDAIQADSRFSKAEAELELFLTLNCIKQLWGQFDFHQVIKDEYSVARGEDFTARRVAAGIVYIVPDHHTLLYSVVSPLSAAIVAGNCVIVEVRKQNAAYG